jgi:hypothetical protein
MELVEGETLTGPLPLDTALDYARQIAVRMRPPRPELFDRRCLANHLSLGYRFHGRDRRHIAQQFSPVFDGTI